MYGSQILCLAFCGVGFWLGYTTHQPAPISVTDAFLFHKGMQVAPDTGASWMCNAQWDSDAVEVDLSNGSRSIFPAYPQARGALLRLHDEPSACNFRGVVMRLKDTTFATWGEKAAAAVEKKPEYEWPNTSPPGENGDFEIAYSFNGKAYKKAEVEPGKWQWVVDEKAEREFADAENHRRELWAALRTRLLTDDEMKEVGQFGTRLNIEVHQPYYANEKAQELQLALAWQAAMRVQPSANPK